MKKGILYFLSILLIAAILAPSVSVLVSIEDTSKIVMDFSEEEKKKENQEDKKEIDEKDKLFQSWFSQNLLHSQNQTSINSFYLESNCLGAVEIFLDPPEPRV